MGYTDRTVEKNNKEADDIIFFSIPIFIRVGRLCLCNISIQDSPYAEHPERKPYSVYSYVYRYSAYIYNLYDILLYDCPYLL